MIAQESAPLRSSFQLRNKKMLARYLAEQFGYDVQFALLLVHLHNCTDIPEMMNLFIIGDDDKYEHYFIPVSEGPNSVCKICQQSESYHSRFIQYGKWNSEMQGLVTETLSQNQENVSDKSDEDSLEYLQNMLQKSHSALRVETFPVPRLHGSFLQQEDDNDKLNNQQKHNCDICCYPFHIDEIAYFNGSHHNICTYCMKSFLEEEILTLRVQRITCPHCNEILSSQIIREFVTNAVYEKYDKFLRNLQIQKNPHLRYCPNPKCSIVINIKQSKSKIKCPKCSIQICNKCSREAHPKKSCDAMLRKELEGLENAKDIQKCRKCKALVEKISGCNHMTCSVCRYEWCWLCGATYSQIHFSPINPLGCAGLQDNHGFNKCKVYALRIFMLIGFIILLPIVLPLTMILVGPVGLSYAAISKCIRRRRFIPLLLIFTIPLGLVMDPFIWIAAILFFVPKFFIMMYEWYRRRREIHENSESHLNRRLIEDGDFVASG